MDHVIIVIIIQIQMKKLAYIPTKIDKQKLYAQIKQQKFTQKEQRVVKDPIATEHEAIQKKKLNKQQLEKLLQRLTQNTKKQYNTQQQTTHILAVNLEIKKRRQQGDKVQNRLLSFGKMLEQKKQELAKELEAQTKEKYYRNVPEITSKAKNLNQKAIDKRLDELIEKKMNKKEKLCEKYQPTFHPVINPQSDFINDLENYGDLHNRMQAKQKEAVKRKESLIKNIEAKQKVELTFKPMIDPNSKNIAEKIPDRRSLSATTPKAKSQSQINKEINRQIYPFAPTINKNTENLISKKYSNLESDCFRRLYKNAKDMLTKHQDKVQQRNRAYTFQPQLNTHSLKIASSIQKKPKQQTVNQFSEKGSQDEYQEIKVGNYNTDYSRTKTYSVRNMKESCKNWQMDLQQKCFNVLHRSGKIGMNLIR